MATYDFGGGCACGLHKECNCTHSAAPSSKYSPKADFTTAYKAAMEQRFADMTELEIRAFFWHREQVLQQRADEEGCSIVFTTLKLAIWHGETEIPSTVTVT